MDNVFNKALSVLKILISRAPAFINLFAALGGKASPELAVVQTAAPVALAMMDAAETALGDGTGEQKKDAVKQGMTAFADAMAEYSTGGQKETWTAVTQADIGSIIDALADTANAIKGETK